MFWSDDREIEWGIIIGEIIMKSYNWTEFLVWVIVWSPIQQVLLPICQVHTLIQGLLNPLRPIIWLVARSHSYYPGCSKCHLASPFLIPISIIIAENNVMYSYSISPSNDLVLILSTANAEYGIHQQCFSSPCCYHYKWISDCSFSFRHAFRQDRPPPTSPPCKLHSRSHHVTSP